MSDRWIDVSSHQRPELMRWGEWGFPRGQYRLTLGNSLDSAAFEHRRRMRLANMATGPYGVPHENWGNLIDQAWLFCDNIPGDDENDDWCDAEREGLTEVQLSTWCDTYDLRGRGRLAVYSGGPWWLSHIPAHRRARYARYPLILAAYPHDTPAGQPVPMDPVSVALRSTPPTHYTLRIPPPWVSVAGHQHTGQGSVPGYDKFIDMGIYQDAPTPPDSTVAEVRAAAGRILERLG